MFKLGCRTAFKCRTYKNPARNLISTRSQKCFTKLEINVMMKAISNVGRITFFLPYELDDYFNLKNN